ncbi:MAG: alpha-ketoacid dehydrogenase subunit alpha/beta [Bacteroidia bacterium]
MMSSEALKTSAELSFKEFKTTVLNDFRIVNESRQTSLLGRKEVLTGKAKFGIFGDGKEVAQIAMAKVFRNGDFRSGYYRDQTFMMAIGALTLEQYFAGLYGHPDINYDPMSAGRQMGGHFATPFIDEHGNFLDLVNRKNSSSDISPTAGQMPRLLGLAYASHFFRTNKELQTKQFTHLSNQGNEVAFGTIGDASTSEGPFWETMNAAGVLQIPMLMSVWDDGHGISVPKKYQTTKESISDALAGFQRTKEKAGFEILLTKGWDYAHLCETYEKAIKICREEHVPILVHVEEVTQPQGHSTSGSHERYKSKERLQWETDFDCIKQMREWILLNALATEVELNKIEEDARAAVSAAKNAAWKAYLEPIKKEVAEVVAILSELEQSNKGSFITAIRNELLSIKEPIRKDIHTAAKRVLRLTKDENLPARTKISDWLGLARKENDQRYSSGLYSNSALHISLVNAAYSAEQKQVDGREILRDNFDALLTKYPQILIFGEDSGKIGGVNQGLEGLQKKYGEHRVFDTGIRECTIIGQAIGLAMRGLRPIAEIQYLDYLLYALQIISDDLATLQWRTKGKQKAPVIIRTRGHRLEGVWHSGSPMGMIINACRGIHICVPRNMTKAAGFYNTLLEADEPALIIEPLNAYRLKENMPTNFGEFKAPLGIPEIIQEGSDITLVTYGSCIRVAQDAIKLLQEHNISVELIDVQTLLPFDVNHQIVESLKKTNRVLFLDEDVPGGASAYLMQQVLEVQKGYAYLDAEPITLAAKEHRPAYGTDGDYFSKPSADDVFDAIYNLMHEANPAQYPAIY